MVAAVKANAIVKLKILRAGQALEVPVTIKTMTLAGANPYTPGLQAVPGMGSPGDLVGQVNELKQRVQMLEARLLALEQRASSGGQPPMLKGTSNSLAPPVPPPSVRSTINR